MNKNQIKFTIISFNTPPIDEDAVSVTLPTTTGNITILPRHTPLLLKLEIGIVKVVTQTETKQFAILGGLARIEKDSVIILTKSFVEGTQLPTTETPETEIHYKEKSKKRREEELMRLYLLKTIKSWKEKHHFGEIKVHE